MIFEPKMAETVESSKNKSTLAIAVVVLVRQSVIFIPHTVSFHSICTSHVTVVLHHMALVQKCLHVLIPNKAIKGPIQQQAGVTLDPVTLLLGGVQN